MITRRIAIITQGKISNVILADESWQMKNDGSEMLEADAIAAGIPREVKPEETPVISVTMTQLKLALVDASLYDAVVSAIAAIADASERIKAQIWFNAATAESNHPLVTQIAGALSLSDDQVLEIFNAALEIN
ncbi:hypothetical protein [Prosthecobacter sp.]|uniref:hypothetical protein n=1 Tax=Prosthecobacter sp. TaxID=1965333 RepID=UPI003784C350